MQTNSTARTLDESQLFTLAIMQTGQTQQLKTTVSQNCSKLLPPHGSMRNQQCTMMIFARQQLVQVDGVLLWVNPIQDARNGFILDFLLREVSSAGIFVSAHPDVILKLGTKEVLYRTRDIGWGCDTHLYNSMDQMRQELPARLANGKPRILKQYRGNGGIGVWKVQLIVEPSLVSHPKSETMVRVHHAKRDCSEEQITLGEFFGRCEEYFLGNGRMIDQEYQERLPEGMIRCYLVHDRVAGFGHQAINALCPAPSGAPPTEAPKPGRRVYHPPDKPEFQALKNKLEHEWVPAVQHDIAPRC